MSKEKEYNIEFEADTMKVTYDQRMRLSDIYAGGASLLHVSAESMRYALISLKGVEITQNNFEEEINKLSNPDIVSIGWELYLDINKLREDKKK